MIDDIIDGDFPVDIEEEEIVITSAEPQPPDVIKRAIRKETKRQLKKRKLTVGFHHGMLNPLPPTWVYPKMNCIQLINLWLLGAPAENVTPLKNLTSKHVLHFDDTGANLSRMRRFMGVIEHYGKLRNVWKPFNAKDFWNGGTVTRLWDGVWDHIKENLVTVTQYEDGRPTSMHKSRSGSLAWRTCHYKLLKRGVFKELKL